jgi:HPt (histidine-containing phosphotransfer) domain-containing protein
LETAAQALHVIRHWEQELQKKVPSRASAAGAGGPTAAASSLVPAHVKAHPTGIPVIGITAYEQYSEPCKTAGMDSFLVKPVGRQLLIRTIAASLEKSAGGGGGGEVGEKRKADEAALAAAAGVKALAEQADQAVLASRARGSRQSSPVLGGQEGQRQAQEWAQAGAEAAEQAAEQAAEEAAEEEEGDLPEAVDLKAGFANFGDADLYSELLQDFATTTLQECLEGMGAAKASGRVDLVLPEFHKLKGAAGYVGATVLSLLCLESHHRAITMHQTPAAAADAAAGEVGMDLAMGWKTIVLKDIERVLREMARVKLFLETDPGALQVLNK